MSTADTVLAQRSSSRFVLFLRSTLFALGLGASTLLFAPLSMLVFPLPYAARYRFITLWTRFNLWWLERICRLGYRVEGLANIPHSPAIVFSKHQSAWETLALQKLFSPQVWVLKRELLWIPFLGWGLAMLRPIAIDRKAGRRAVRQVVEQGRRRLQAGCWVVIFPEGTRVPPGERRPYRAGGAVLAQQTGCPVVPVAHNAGEYWPRKSFIKRPGTIEVVIGSPITSEGRTATEITRLAEEWIETTMTRLATQTIPAEPGGDSAPPDSGGPHGGGSVEDAR